MNKMWRYGRFLIIFDVEEAKHMSRACHFKR